MADVRELAAMLARGELAEASAGLAGRVETDYREIAAAVEQRVADRGDLLELASDLAQAFDLPGGLMQGERMRRVEGMRLVAAEIAVRIAGDDWRDVLAIIRALSGDVSMRVRESLVRLIAAVASGRFEESRDFWMESVLEADGALAAAVLRGLALSDAPALGVLEVYASAVADLRKDVRHALGPRAIPDLGRREPELVYRRLREWAGHADEITRWNVAQALASPLGGVYVEEAMDILGILAADERPSIRQATARAAVQVAQRRPSYVLPILARWREDESRHDCAMLALESLVRR